MQRAEALVNLQTTDGRIETNNQQTTADSKDITYVVSYEGETNYDDGSKITNEDTAGMDNKKVSIMMQKTNKSIQEFDINNPRFDWVQSPTEGQMTLNLLLTALDQTLTANSKKIPPPRGLSSINKLGLKRAIFSSRSGKYTAAIYCEIDVPEFDFLPLDLTTVNNTGYVHYYTNTNVTVHILGEVLFEEGQRYHTHFKKDADSDEYKVFLTAHQGVKLSFEAIKKVVFPTISTESDKILSDDSNSLKLLSRFNIEEENVSIRNPVIEIRLVPYLFYRVNGMLSSGMTRGESLHSAEPYKPFL